MSDGLEPLHYEIRFQTDLPAPPEQVWAALCDTRAPQPYYFGLRLVGEPQPGAALRYEDAAGRHTFIEGRWHEVSPPSRLALDFQFTRFRGEWTRLVWEIHRTDTGCRLITSHRGPALRTILQVREGHPHIDRALLRWLRDGQVPFRMRMYATLFRLRAAVPNIGRVLHG